MNIYGQGLVVVVVCNLRHGSADFTRNRVGGSNNNTNIKCSLRYPVVPDDNWAANGTQRRDKVNVRRRLFSFHRTCLGRLRNDKDDEDDYTEDVGG